MPFETNRATRFVAAALAIAFVVGSTTAGAQQPNVLELERLSRTYRQQLESRRGADYQRLVTSTDPAVQALNRNPDFGLTFIRPGGVPAYFILHNLNAAKTVRTWDSWPAPVGGGAHTATGATTAPGELAVWDGGGIRTTHAEFGGRATQMDSPTQIIQHATHVSGTLIAAGVNASARGMSYEAPLHAYDWYSDTSEMATAAAAGMQVSNHSYGYATGWEPSGSNWYWWGDMAISTTEDYGFGYYDDSAQAYDQIMYNAPQYLICMSAGNDRNDSGPSPGSSHYHWSGTWVLSNDIHGTDYQNGGYDTISWTGTAKNILLVGSVNDISGGYTAPGDVVQAAYSSWGPTDDGRIKPDIVSNGQNLTSCSHATDNAYAILSGTSMASPSAAGSVNLIAQEYEIARGSTPWGSTVKALVINGADDAGLFAGPDYQNGWGLLNTKRALDIVYANQGDNMGVLEATLTSNSNQEYWFALTIPDDIRVTIAWTDPPGTVSAPALDSAAKKLVNDLDMVLEEVYTGTTTEPWNLSRTLPGNAATRGPNHVDNVEQIDLVGPAIGVYKVTVSHTGSLSGGSQKYSLVWRGMHETATPVAGAARAPSFWIGDPRPNPVAGAATVDFGVDAPSVVSIYVYDVAGHRVATLLENSQRGTGTGTVTLDSSRLASGVYFIRMESAAQTTTRKITVVK